VAIDMICDPIQMGSGMTRTVNILRARVETTMAMRVVFAQSSSKPPRRVNAVVIRG